MMNGALAVSNPRAVAGNNSAPGPLVFGSETMAALSEWLKDHPVIESEDAAREAKLLADRAKVSIEEMETERDKLVRPLNTQVANINERYRAVREPLKKIFDALKARLTDFAKIEERKRFAEAEAKRKALEEAERLARDAEARERELHENAKLGELDIDLGAATVDADQAFANFKRADREAARADKATHVRVAGGFIKRALTLKSHEILSVTNAHEAIEAIGLTDTIRDAILSSARAYRKEFGELPDGITSSTQRRI